MSKLFGCAIFVIGFVIGCQAQSHESQTRLQAEYYAAAYAKHYDLPVAFVRAVVVRGSSAEISILG